MSVQRAAFYGSGDDARETSAPGSGPPRWESGRLSIVQAALINAIPVGQIIGRLASELRESEPAQRERFKRFPPG